MDLVCELPGAPSALFDHDGERLSLAFADGLAILEDEGLGFFAGGPLDGAARGPDGCYYCTRGDRILRFDPLGHGEPDDISASFAGQVQGRGRIACTPDGDIWVEGCTTRRRPDGSFAPTPAFHAAGWKPPGCPPPPGAEAVAACKSSQ